MKNIKNRPYLLLTLAVLFWAGNFILGRAFHGEIPPIALAFWRWVGLHYWLPGLRYPICVELIGPCVSAGQQSCYSQFSASLHLTPLLTVACNILRRSTLFCYSR